METPKRRTWPIAVAMLAATVWWLVLASLRHTAEAGDAHAVYFPVVQALHAGHGWSSWFAEAQGIGRMPFYPLVLFSASLFSPDLYVAAHRVGVIGGLAVLWVLAALLGRAKTPPWLVAVSLAAVATHPNFVRMMAEPLPDMLALSLMLGAAWALVRFKDDEHLRYLVACGVLLGLANITRFNTVALLPAFFLVLVFWRLKVGLPKRIAVAWAAWLVGLIFIVGPMVALRSADTDFPILTMDPVTVGDEGSAGLPTAMWEGLKQTPARLQTTIHWVTILLAGVAAGVALARRQLPQTQVILPSVALMFVALLPIHYEPRYYLFATVAFIPAALWMLHLGLAKIRLGLVVALVGVGLASWHGWQSWRAAKHVQTFEAGWTRLCEAVVSYGSKGPLMVGTRDRAFLYSRFKYCEVPVNEGPQFGFSYAAPGDGGLDLWLELPRVDKPPGEVLAETERGALMRLETAQITATGTVTKALDEPLVFRLPKQSKLGCLQFNIQLPAGRHHVSVDLASDPPLVARFVLDPQFGAERALFAQGAMKTVSAGFMTTKPGSVLTSLCAAERNVSPGHLRAKSLVIHSTPNPVK